MSNIEIDAPLVNGSLRAFFDKGESCLHAVEFIVGDDLRPPPRSLHLTVHTESGKTVKLMIPYDHEGSAKVSIDGSIV